MRITTLDSVPIEKIHEAFSAAFADYVEPFTMTQDELGRMLERRGFRADLSFAAIEDNEIVGFTLNGIGNWEGVPTAYDTGTGVRREFRKKGIASRIFDASLPVLEEHGIRRYLLEVIRTNRNAADLYLKAGFRVTREFDYWTGQTSSLSIPDRELPSGFSVKALSGPDWHGLDSFWDAPPSWQNSTDSIRRMSTPPAQVGVEFEGRIIAYGCMERATGDLPQLAVHGDYRRKGLASAILVRLLTEAQCPGLRVINTEAKDTTIRGFLTSIGLEPGPGQYEMILEI